MGYVAGVAAGAWLLGALEPSDVPLEPPDEPEPEPPMFGQLAPLWFPRPDGAVGAVVPPLVPPLPLVAGAGEADGSGLAAETTAAAPPMRRSADSAAVIAMRLRPAPDGPASLVAARSGDAGGATGVGGVRGAGIAGWTCCSTVRSFGRAGSDGVASSVAQPMGTSGPVGSGIDRLSAAGRATGLASIVPAQTESGLRAMKGLSGTS